MQGPKQDFQHNLTTVDPDEKVLAVIKRHPFGIIKLYFQVLFGFGLIGGLTYYLMPTIVDPDQNPAAYSAVGLIAIVIVIFMVFIVAIATIIYFKSELIITDKTITQNIQTSIFSRKTSQLAVSSVEDVTANKDGVFPTIFNFGRLLIETAGEQENFHFDYCPHADHYAKLVLETRQQFMGDKEREMIHTAQQNVKFSDSKAQVESSTSGFGSSKQRQTYNPFTKIGDIAVDGTDDDQLNKSNKSN